jgi:hypothetical protein
MVPSGLVSVYTSLLINFPMRGRLQTGNHDRRLAAAILFERGYRQILANPR